MLPKLPHPDISIAIGSPGSGKTTVQAALARRFPRRLYWDPVRMFDDEGARDVRSASELLAAIKDRAPVVRWLPRAKLRKEFEQFCIGARAMTDCAMVVDELATVSRSGAAPDEWGRALREHRHFRLRIIASTARPQESDKTILSCVTHAYLMKLQDEHDRRYICERLRVDPALFDQLPQYHYLKRDEQGRLTLGRVAVK